MRRAKEQAGGETGYYGCIKKFIKQYIEQNYPLRQVVMHVDRYQLRFRPRYKCQVVGLLGERMNVFRSGSKLIEFFQFDGTGLVKVTFNYAKPYWFFLDLHQPTQDAQAAILEGLRKHSIPFTRRESELPVDLYPVNPAHVFPIRDMIRRHMVLPHGRVSQFNIVGGHSLGTDCLGKEGHRWTGSKGSGVYIRPKEEFPKEFVRLEPNVNKDHDSKGVQFPVNLDEVRYDKLVEFRRFDLERALGLGVFRFKTEQRRRVRLGLPTVKASPEFVKMHLRAQLNEMRYPEVTTENDPTAGEEVLADQMDRYAQWQWSHLNDKSEVFPKIV